MPATTRASRRRRATDTQVIGGILAALDINNGGTLEFQMSAMPNTARGIAKESRPFSVSANQ